VELAIESVLEERSHLLDQGLPRRRSLIISVSLHLVFFASVVIIPLLTIRAPEPIEFTPITIVPIQALGVETPVAEPARTQTPPKPEPAKPVLPEPESQPARKPAPVQETRPSEPAPSSQGVAPEGALGQRQGSPLGSTLGTSVFGAAVGGFDSPDFVYGYYVDQMLGMISTNWQRPALGANVEAIIHFRIHKDGHISEVRITQSSGYNSFDLAGLRAVRLAAPFPKLPQSYRHKSLGVNLILR